jgi:hypothetical protein
MFTHLGHSWVRACVGACPQRPIRGVPISRGIIVHEAGVVQWQNVSFPKWIALTFPVAYRSGKEPNEIL